MVAWKVVPRRLSWCSPGAASSRPARSAERERILAERDIVRLGRWMAAARDCTSIAALITQP